MADDGRQVVVDIYQPDEFFGESAFLGFPQRTRNGRRAGKHQAHDVDDSEIEDIATRRPKLAIALLQLLVQRSMDFGSRIESFSVDNIARRLARALIRFSERLGHQTEDGSVQMIPFTHELLSQYVGTSREIVTHYMNQFRRQGYLRYSRKASCCIGTRCGSGCARKTQPLRNLRYRSLTVAALNYVGPEPFLERIRITVTLSGLPAS